MSDPNEQNPEVKKDVSDATSPMPKKITETVSPIEQSPPETELCITTEIPKYSRKWWWLLLWRFLKRVFQIGCALVSLLWAFALWDSYRPKITVTPGPTLDAKFPLGTVFIIQNQGALPIYNVSFDILWTYADDPNQTRNVIVGLRKIPKLNSLEQHGLLNIVDISTNSPANSTTTNEMPHSAEWSPTPFAHHALVLWFEITYNPMFFSQKKTSLFFIGIWDAEGNFQWVPTGNADIRSENVDDQLLRRANDLTRDTERRRAEMASNLIAQAAAMKTNDVHAPSNTNGVAPVHTTNNTTTGK